MMTTKKKHEFGYLDLFQIKIQEERGKKRNKSPFI